MISPLPTRLLLQMKRSKRSKSRIRRRSLRRMMWPPKKKLKLTTKKKRTRSRKMQETMMKKLRRSKLGLMTATTLMLKWMKMQMTKMKNRWTKKREKRKMER